MALKGKAYLLSLASDVDGNHADTHIGKGRGGATVLPANDLLLTCGPASGGYGSGGLKYRIQRKT